MTNLRGDETDPTVLTDFQVDVARLFFSLPASDRFLLAGGAALLAQHMTVRPTHDLDFFTGTPGLVEWVRNEFEAAAAERGWTVAARQSTATFCRLVVHGPEDLLVDIALDSPPRQPGTASFIGPTFAPVELAARKLVALFDRAAARDSLMSTCCSRPTPSVSSSQRRRTSTRDSTSSYSPSSWGPCAGSWTGTYPSRVCPPSRCASSSTSGDGSSPDRCEPGVLAPACLRPDTRSMKGPLTVSTAGLNGTRYVQTEPDGLCSRPTESARSRGVGRVRFPPPPHTYAPLTCGLWSEVSRASPDSFASHGNGDRFSNL